jgi:hypothetical protein
MKTADGTGNGPDGAAAADRTDGLTRESLATYFFRASP